MSERFTDEFLPSVRYWCERNADKLSKRYSTTHQGFPSVYVIGNQPRWEREELGRPLAELGQKLQQRGWQCNLMQIPREDSEHYDDFLAAEAAVLVFGENT
ncbi:MAG TPA: hypothetical protein VKE94_07330 [Gemmataceae bacterium]|nr:hypothetical protein [Gemmataceae bacterium]